MADFTQINQEIDDNIKQNGVNAITGAKMNTVLKDMVSAVNNEKQDIISDIDEIRSGAEAGATAFQKPSEGIPSTDMDEQVQAALDNAENAVLYSEQSVGITDQQRNTALANVSNQTANSTTGKMGYKVLDPTKTFAEQVTAENTIYEIRDVFDLNGQTFTFPTNCTLIFNGGMIKNGTLSGVIKNQILRPEWFGAKGDGVTDDSEAFNAIVALVNSGSAGKISLRRTNYKVTNTLYFQNDIQFIGNGATLVFTGNSAFACIEISKTTPLQLVDSGAVSGNKGENIISVEDASEIAKGDYIIIYDTTDNSWSSERAYYHSGDIFKVVSVSGSTIGLSESLTQNYSGNSIVIYKMNTISANVSDLNIIGDFEDGTTTKSLTPILLRCGVGCTLKNLNLSKTNISHLSLVNCYNVVIDNIKADTNSIAVSLNYGITIGCSKKVIVGNCILKSTRHGLTIGGGETLVFPSRFISVHDCIIGTYGDTSNALDSHNNAEYITFVDNQVFGGISCSASHFDISGNRIFSKHGIQSAIDLVNGRYRTGIIRNNEIHWNAVNNGDCGINIYTNVDSDADSVLTIQGNKFILDYVGTISSYCTDIYLRNGTTHKYKKLVISDNVFHDGTYTLVFDFFANSSLLDFLVFSGNECRDAVQLNETCGITESLFKNNMFEKSGASALSVHNGGTKCTITGNHFVSDNYAITFGGTTQNTNTTFIVSKNTFDITIVSNGRAALNSSKSLMTVFVDNFIFSSTTGKNINDIYVINSDKVVCRGNKYSVNDLRIYAKPASVTSFLREYGPTADRNKTITGDTYFDTDLGKMIVWNGTAWVNLDGTALS